MEAQELKCSYCNHAHDEELECELDCLTCNLLAEEVEAAERAELEQELEPMNCMDCGQSTEDEYFSLEDELWCAVRLEEPDLSEALRLLSRFNAMSKYDGVPTTEWYYEHTRIVSKYCEYVRGYLCVGCIETRLGRQLEPDDFNQEAPVNWPDLAGSDRLWSRLTGLPEDQRRATP